MDWQVVCLGRQDTVFSERACFASEIKKDYFKLVKTVHNLFRIQKGGAIKLHHHFDTPLTDYPFIWEQ